HLLPDHRGDGRLRNGGADEERAAICSVDDGLENRESLSRLVGVLAPLLRGLLTELGLRGKDSHADEAAEGARVLGLVREHRGAEREVNCVHPLREAHLLYPREHLVEFLIGRRSELVYRVGDSRRYVSRQTPERLRVARREVEGRSLETSAPRRSVNRRPDVGGHADDERVRVERRQADLRVRNGTQLLVVAVLLVENLSERRRVNDLD